jgi:uncharacterized protein YbjT (DUF2867 family)
VLVADLRDTDTADQLNQKGFHVRCTNTIMKSSQDKEELARAIMTFVRGETAARASTDPR